MVFDDHPGWAYECMWLAIMLQILICTHCMQLASNDIDDDDDEDNDLVLILCPEPGTISNWLYGGCLVGMFLDLVSVGHISMSHAKICPGTPLLVNISFSLPTYWNHPVSSGRHVRWGGMA